MEGYGWWEGFTQPLEAFKVFDYKTGYTLVSNNKLGVKVSLSKWKTSYYPKQYFKMICDGKNNWIRLLKSSSVTFTLTYPKKYKDIVVGIGFSNRVDVSDEGAGDVVDYNSGKLPYGECEYYKKGKKTMSYMRLNK